jgi:hypothetical protein
MLSVLVLLKYVRQHAIIVQSKLELLITQCYSFMSLLCQPDHMTCLCVLFVINKASVTLQTGTSTISFVHTYMAFNV